MTQELSEALTKACRELETALNKQVPKKMVDVDNKKLCPRCSEILYNIGECEDCIIYAYEYCPYCGQKLDNESKRGNE